MSLFPFNIFTGFRKGRYRDPGMPPDCVLGLAMLKVAWNEGKKCFKLKIRISNAFLYN